MLTTIHLRRNTHLSGVMKQLCPNTATLQVIEPLFFIGLDKRKLIQITPNITPLSPTNPSISALSHIKIIEITRFYHRLTLFHR